MAWTTALVGVASVTAAAAIISVKPRDPSFQLISITLNSLKLSLPVVDVELILTVQVTNPNVVPIQYSSTELSIFYDGSLLGTAHIDAGSQPAKSTRLLQLPARLSGIELAQHPAKFVGDLRRREMVLDAAVDMEGTAKVLWWDHKFKVHMDSHVVVDPVSLDVVDQENKAEMELFVT